jgi:hypothetical protein
LYRCIETSNEKGLVDQFDYIVVGNGSAGADPVTCPDRCRSAPCYRFELSDNIVVEQPTQIRYGERRFNGRVVEVGRSVVAGGNNHPSLKLGLALDADGDLPANLTVRPYGRLNQRLI